MEGVPGQCFPSRSNEAVQMRARRARLLSPPSTPHQNVLGSRFLRHASRDNRGEPSSVSGTESAPQIDAERKLKLGDVLTVFARLLASHEVRAALLLVEELVSSDVAQSELRSTLVMFNRQSVDFVNKYSSEVSKMASDFIQRCGQKESSAETDGKAVRRATKSDTSADSALGGPNPVPDRASGFIQRGCQEESGAGTDVKAVRRATKSDKSTDSTWGGPNPVPDRASDFIQRGGQEESDAETDVPAALRATKSDESKDCTRSYPSRAPERIRGRQFDASIGTPRCPPCAGFNTKGYKSYGYQLQFRVGPRESGSLPIGA